MFAVMIFSIIWFFFIAGLVSLALSLYYAVTGDKDDYPAMMILIKAIAFCFVVVLIAALVAQAIGV